MAITMCQCQGRQHMITDVRHSLAQRQAPTGWRCVWPVPGEILFAKLCTVQFCLISSLTQFSVSDNIWSKCPIQFPLCTLYSNSTPPPLVLHTNVSFSSAHLDLAWAPNCTQCHASFDLWWQNVCWGISSFGQNRTWYFWSITRVTLLFCPQIFSKYHLEKMSDQIRIMLTWSVRFQKGQISKHKSIKF